MSTQEILPPKAWKCFCTSKMLLTVTSLKLFTLLSSVIFLPITFFSSSLVLFSSFFNHRFKVVPLKSEFNLCKNEKSYRKLTSLMRRRTSTIQTHPQPQNNNRKGRQRKEKDEKEQKKRRRWRWQGRRLTSFRDSPISLMASRLLILQPWMNSVVSTLWRKEPWTVTEGILRQWCPAMRNQMISVVSTEIVHSCYKYEL